jgi:steroid delta-isomerase-like uncharacterized protein
MKFSIRSCVGITPVVMLFLMCLSFSCQKQPQDAITQEEAQALNESVLKIWNDGNLALVDSIFTPECVRHDYGMIEDVVSLPGLKSYFSSIRSSFPDLEMTIQETIVKGDKIVWRWMLEGTNTGPMGNQPPTGKNVRFPGVTIARLEFGKIAEMWDFYNQATLLQQLGFTLYAPEIQSEQKP